MRSIRTSTGLHRAHRRRLRRLARDRWTGSFPACCRSSRAPPRRLRRCRWRCCRSRLSDCRAARSALRWPCGVPCSCHFLLFENLDDAAVEIDGADHMAGFVPAVAKTTGEDDHLAQDMILGLVGAVVVVHALEQPIVGGVDQIELAALGVVPDLEFHFLAPFWISRAMSSTSSCIVISALTRSAHACWASLVTVL